MDKARQAVSDFVSRDGKHKTTVDESVAPAVTEEHVRPHRHENITTAIDREVHQDHHHTTVQPVVHKETLPEQHSHNIIPVEHKTFEHGNERDVRDKLDREAAKYKNTSVTHDTTHSTAAAPTVEAERVHHHVHEHVQPVINKETIAPKVIHTTVPIHETHHAAAEHHGTSVLPTKSLAEFTGAGGILDGKGSTHHGEYDGCPRPYNKSLQGEQLEADRNMHHHTPGHNHGSTNAGPHNSSLANKADPRVDSDLDGRTGVGHSGSGHHNGNSTTGSGIGSTTSNASATGTHTKPSLMDRLNPMKDTDHDGKKGFMD